MRYIFCAPTDFEDEQREGIKAYLSQRNIYLGDCTTLLCDYNYSDKEYDAGVKYMLSELHEGDILYVWDLSSLGKTLENLYTNLLFSSSKQVVIVQCLDGEIIGNETNETNAIIRGIGIASRIAYNAKQSSTKRGLARRKQLIEKEGGFYSKSGKWVTRLGSPTPPSPKAAEASARNAKLRKKKWQETSVGYQWVIKQLQAGTKRKDIIDEFNKRHITNPEDYSTVQGKPLTAPILSNWASQYEIEKENGSHD